MICLIQHLELSKKSYEQLVELQRASHEFYVNNLVRLRSRLSKIPDWSSNPISIFNPNSFFLDLAHTLPISREIFFSNHVQLFLKRRKSLNITLLQNDCSNAPSRGRYREGEPLSLMQLSAIKLRNTVSIEKDKVYLTLADFQNSKHIPVRRVPLPILKYLETLSFNPTVSYCHQNMTRRK